MPRRSTGARRRPPRARATAARKTVQGRRGARPSRRRSAHAGGRRTGRRPRSAPRPDGGRGGTRRARRPSRCATTCPATASDVRAMSSRSTAGLSPARRGRSGSAAGRRRWSRGGRRRRSGHALLGEHDAAQHLHADHEQHDEDEEGEPAALEDRGRAPRGRRRGRRRRRTSRAASRRRAPPAAARGPADWSARRARRRRAGGGRGRSASQAAVGETLREDAPRVLARGLGGVGRQLVDEVAAREAADEQLEHADDDHRDGDRPQLDAPAPPSRHPDGSGGEQRARRARASWRGSAGSG